MATRQRTPWVFRAWDKLEWYSFLAISGYLLAYMAVFEFFPEYRYEVSLPLILAEEAAYSALNLI
ncbi:hypothetical protein [Halomarina rubra]|uniref:Uncharacterized protein n=1 Tax=Halomarina rubra TaxID=2071873 RepID=A0ABD6B104_9EURY|nr:hypothetical protein [Halomarina rubra]